MLLPKAVFCPGSIKSLTKGDVLLKSNEDRDAEEQTVASTSPINFKGIHSKFPEHGLPARTDASWLQAALLWAVPHLKTD